MAVSTLLGAANYAAFRSCECPDQRCRNSRILLGSRVVSVGARLFGDHVCDVYDVCRVLDREVNELSRVKEVPVRPFEVPGLELKRLHGAVF